MNFVAAFFKVNINQMAFLGMVAMKWTRFSSYASTDVGPRMAMHTINEPPCPVFLQSRVSVFSALDFLS